MIEINRDTACILYLFIAIVVVLSQWYKSNKDMKKKEIISYSLATKKCEFCDHNFMGQSEDGIFRCPQCNCLNVKKST